jgi:hypothetical protein
LTIALAIGDWERFTMGLDRSAVWQLLATGNWQLETDRHPDCFDGDVGY